MTVRNGVFAGFDDMVATYSSDTFYKEAIMIMATIVWRNSTSGAAKTSTVPRSYDR